MKRGPYRKTLTARQAFAVPKPVKGSWADGQDVMGYDADLGREDEEIQDARVCMHGLIGHSCRSITGRARVCVCVCVCIQACTCMYACRVYACMFSHLVFLYAFVHTIGPGHVD